LESRPPHSETPRNETHPADLAQRGKAEVRSHNDLQEDPSRANQLPQPSQPSLTPQTSDNEKAVHRISDSVRDASFAPIAPPQAGMAAGSPAHGLVPASATDSAAEKRTASRIPWEILGQPWVSAVISAVVHALALIVLALITIHIQRGLGEVSLVAVTSSPSRVETAAEDLILESRDTTDEPINPRWDSSPSPREVANLLEGTADQAETPATDAVITETGSLPIDPLRSFSRPSGGGLEGRSPEKRAQLAADAGGTPESEEAVERGLRWIAAHQSPDGGWTFDLKKSYCAGLCANAGTEASTTAATAIALLPFLGAGYTHTQGEHRETVRKGLYYLLRRGRTTPEGLDLREGTMYAQGIAAIALCEAYAMTHDEALRDPAQSAIRFIQAAQDRGGGGWRYAPGEPGDTTVTGWQWMALKSGQLAGLAVSRSTLYAADRFLDSVQSDGGSQYGYLTPEARRATTAVGLLCRMYGGWTRGHPALARGVSHLSTWGPSPVDIYYNYYAAQVLRHWGGSDWKFWNRPMRDYLVSTQAVKGHENGSWYFDDEHSRVGGRLYTTAMAVMILEVYYRYLPLYGEEVFPPF